MSKILDRLRDSGDSNGRCHVRVSDNMTYGPVALTTVCQWAAQGRVTAESEISFDRNEWVRADSIPELGLEWVASSDGADDFGPFNMMALSALVRRGLISPDARLKQRETDETLDVPQALARATASRPLDAAASRLLQTVQATGSDEGQSVASQSGALEADGTTAVAAAGSDALVSELRQELAAAQAEGGRLTERLRVEQDGWDSLKGELNRAEALLAETRARQEALQAESDSREIEQGGRIAELEELLKVAHEGRTAADRERQAARESESTHIEHGEQKESELEKLRSRVEEVENAVATAHERVGQLEAERAEVRTTLAEREEELSLLNQTREVEQQRADEKAEGLTVALAAAQATRDGRETVLAAEIAAVAAQLSETSEAAAQREVEWGLQVDQLRTDVSDVTERLSLSEADLKREQVAAGALDSKLEVARQKVKDEKKQAASVGRKLKNRDKKVAQFKVDLKQRDKTIKALRDEAPKAATRVVELEAALAASAAEVEVMRAESASLAAAHSEHTATVTEHVELASQAEAEKQEIEDRVAELTAALAQAQAESEQAQVRQSALASEVEQARKTQSSLQADLDRVETEMAAAATAHAAQLAEKESRFAEKEAHVTEHVNQGARIEAEKHALESRVAELKKALAGRDSVGAEQKKSLADKSSALEDAEKALAAKDKALEDAAQALAAKDAALEDAEKALSGKDEALADAEKALSGKDEALADAKAALKAAVAATDDLLVEHGKLEVAQEANRVVADTLQGDLKQAESKTATLRAELDDARAEAAKPGAEPEPPKEWYLRYDGTNMLGPVGFEELVQWARDCRVAHDHDVSSDKIFWAKAADVSALAMEWMVTLVDGTEYGPINKQAIHDLIADESVTKDAELTHCQTGEKLKAQDVKPE